MKSVSGIGSKWNQTLVGYSYKFCANIALFYLAGRTNCRSKVFVAGLVFTSFWYCAEHFPYILKFSFKNILYSFTCLIKIPIKFLKIVTLKSQSYKFYKFYTVGSQDFNCIEDQDQPWARVQLLRPNIPGQAQEITSIHSLLTLCPHLVEFNLKSRTRVIRNPLVKANT